MLSLILNFLTEIYIIEGNPQTLPQIKIDDVEVTSCLNVTAIICPNNLRLIIICRLGTRVRFKIAIESFCVSLSRNAQDLPSNANSLATARIRNIPCVT
jgi:hypothetical protein